VWLFSFLDNKLNRLLSALMLHVNDRHRSHGMWTDLKRNTKLIIIVVEMVSGYFALDVN